MAPSKFDPAPLVLSVKAFILSRMRKLLSEDEDWCLSKEGLVSNFDLEGILRDIAVLYRNRSYADFCRLVEAAYAGTRAKLILEAQRHFMEYYMEGPTTDSLESLFLHLESDWINKIGYCEGVKVKKMDELLPEDLPELFVWSEKSSEAFSNCLEAVDYREYVDAVMRNYAKTPGVKISYVCRGPPYDVWVGHPHWKGWCDEVECRCHHNKPEDAV